MAAADYRLCDVCAAKTFYDANLDYDDFTREADDGPWLPGGVGSWAVICDECARTHVCIVVERGKEGE